MNQESAAKIKEVIDFANKSPHINELKQKCLEIRDGQRKTISKKIIDDAFDAFGVIVKEISNDADERIELQKQVSKDLMCDIIRMNNITIE